MKSMRKMTVKDLVRGAIIAAIYALLTIFLAPISSGLVQCRVSEALCILPYFTFAAVPGLFIGCLAANLLTGAVIYDVVFGSLATLLAAYATYLMRNRVSKYLAPMPPVIFNAFIIGALLVYVYGVDVSYLAAASYVAVGELIACYALGLPLLLVLERYKEKLF